MLGPQHHLECIADFAEKRERRRYMQVDLEMEDNYCLGIGDPGTCRGLILSWQCWYCLGIDVEMVNVYGLYEAAVVPQMGSVRVADP